MTKSVSLSLNNIKKHNFKDFDSSYPSKNKLNVELGNGAKCNFDGNTLGCTYSAKSHNPFKQPVDNPNKNYRFIDEIKIKNIELKSMECNGEDMEDLKTECENEIEESCEKLKRCSEGKIDFEGKENIKVDYTVKYPAHSGRGVNVISDGKKSTIKVEKFRD